MRLGRRPTARGWAVLIAGAVLVLVAYTQQYAELLYPAAFCAMLLIAGLAHSLLTAPRLTVLRRFTPSVGSAGGRVGVRLAVRNGGARRGVAASVRDGVPWSGPGMGPAPTGRVPALDAGELAAVDYELHPPARGVFEIGPLLIEQTDPFGVIRTRVRVGGTDRLVVTPALSRLPESGRVISEAEGEAAVLQRLALGSDDDLMTREYRPGDALRRVHWRASARAGDLMVRQEEPRTRPDVRVIVETRRVAFADLDGDGEESASFEWALKMLASLGVHLDDTGYRVEVVETGVPQIQAPDAVAARSGRHDAFLESLALAGLARTTTPVATDASGPVLAIVADRDERVASWIASRRQRGDRGTAFVLTSAGRAVFELFERAGWICVAVSPDSDVGSAWNAARRQVDRVTR